MLQVLYKKDEMERTKSILAPALNAIYPLVNLEDRRTTQELRKPFGNLWGKSSSCTRPPRMNTRGSAALLFPLRRLTTTNIAFDYVDHGDATGHLRHFCEVEALDITMILSSGSTITIGPCVTNKQDFFIP